MADNFSFTEGAGKSGAADDVGGVLFAKVKLDFGTDGVTAPALAGTGAMATGVQRVTIATDDPATVLLGTIDSDTNDIKTAVELLDNAVDGNYLNTNLNIAGTDCVGNAGVNAAGVLRVTIATDDECNNFLGTIDADTGNMVTALQLIDNAVDGNYLNVNLNIAGTDCDGGSGAQGAQTQRVILATDDPAVAHLNNILTAVQIMDDWDDANYCNVNLNVAGTDVTGDQGNSDAQTIRVAIADDDTLLTTIDADTGKMVTALEIIDDWDDANYCNVNINLAGTDAGAGEGALDGTELRVTIATDDDGVAHLATIAGDTTNIETAIQIIDDWDATHDSAASADGPQMMAAYDATKPAVVEDGDAVRVLADEYGRLLEGVEKTAWQEDYDSADASGEGEAVKASAASTVLVVQSYVISVDAEMWVKLQEEDSTALTGKFWLKAGGGVAITLPKSAPLVLGTDSDLEVITEGAGNISVSATGYTIPG